MWSLQNGCVWSELSRKDMGPLQRAWRRKSNCAFKKNNNYKPPYSRKERGSEREKKWERQKRRHRGTPTKRERGKEKSEGGCNKTNLDVCASCRCGHCEYCGRNGTAWGEPLFFCCFFFLVIPHAAAPPSPASIPLSESQAILASW